MRELILKMFMSLDGFVGSTDGDHTWMINPDEPDSEGRLFQTGIGDP